MMAGSKKTPRRSRAWVRERRPSKGISCWSMSVMNELALSCGPGPARQGARSAVDRVIHFYQNLLALGNPEIHPGAETNKPDPLPPGHRVARLLPGHHPAGDESGDLFELDLSPV